MSPLAHATPQLHDNNQFSVLETPELEDVLECEEEVPESPQVQPPPPVEPRRPCRPKWEKRMGQKLVICSLVEDPKCIMLSIHLKTTDTMEEASTEAMVDTGVTRDFIDQDFVAAAKLPTCKLSEPIPVYNVDGIPNEARSICEVVDVIIIYKGHSECILLAVTCLGKQSMILGYSWLNKHNPEINFCARTVKMTRCLSRCCIGCQTERQEAWKALRKEVQSINACQTGPSPIIEEDKYEEVNDLEENPNFTHHSSTDNLRSFLGFNGGNCNSEMGPNSTCQSSTDEWQAFDDEPLKEGDRIWATGLLPQ